MEREREILHPRRFSASSSAAISSRTRLPQLLLLCTLVAVAPGVHHRPAEKRCYDQSQLNKVSQGVERSLSQEGATGGAVAYSLNPSFQGCIVLKFSAVLGFQDELVVEFREGNAWVAVEFGGVLGKSTRGLLVVLCRLSPGLVVGIP
jgi:hypothetical protein